MIHPDLRVWDLWRRRRQRPDQRLDLRAGVGIMRVSKNLKEERVHEDLGLKGFALSGFEALTPE